MSQKEVRVRTSNDHEIDTFSLGEDGRKDANVGMDSQNNVGFVLCVGWKTLGTGEFYCVLASHPSRVRGLKLTDKNDTLTRNKNLVNVSFFSFGLSKKLYNKYIESF